MHHSRTHKGKLFSLFSKVFKLDPRNVPQKKGTCITTFSLNKSTHSSSSKSFLRRGHHDERSRACERTQQKTREQTQFSSTTLLTFNSNLIYRYFQQQRNRHKIDQQKTIESFFFVVIKQFYFLIESEFDQEPGIESLL